MYDENWIDENAQVLAEEKDREILELKAKAIRLTEKMEESDNRIWRYYYDELEESP